MNTVFESPGYKFNREFQLLTVLEFIEFVAKESHNCLCCIGESIDKAYVCTALRPFRTRLLKDYHLLTCQDQSLFITNHPPPILPWREGVWRNGHIHMIASYFWPALPTLLGTWQEMDVL